MRIHLDDISMFYKCPRYLSLSKKYPYTPPIDKKVEVISFVLKKAYSYSIETGYKATWRRILGWTDTFVFRKIDVTNKNELQTAKELSEAALLFLGKYCEVYYFKENILAYSNIGIRQELGRHVITYTLPIIKGTDPPTVVLVDNIETTLSKMYNDINKRAIVWLTSKALNERVITLENLVVGARGRLFSTRITCNKKRNNRIEKIIEQVCECIDAGISYPIVSESCKQCIYIRRCKF